MKKTAVIIFTIAILGVMGLYTKSHDFGPSSQVKASSRLISNTSSTSPTTNTSYKDGTYTGGSEDTPYGTVQIAVVISGGKIADVDFLQMPNDQQESQRRTAYSEPLLKQTTLNKQSANIDFISGATDTSYGYQRSLQAALNQAQLT